MASRRTLLLTTAALASRSPCEVHVAAFTNAFTAAVRNNIASRSIVPSSFSFKGTSIHAPATITSASTCKRWMGTDSGDQIPPPINRVQKDIFSQVIDEYETEGREASGYVVIDVRGEDEVAFTGKVSPNTHTLPLPLIAQGGAFSLDEDDFEEQYGFAKPSLDETLVFTCKAGVRSNYAAQYAALAGYSKLFDYIGGADEWFR